MKEESVKNQFIEKINEFVKVKRKLQSEDCYDEHLTIGALDQDLRQIGKGDARTNLVIELIWLMPKGLTPEEIKRIITLF